MNIASFIDHTNLKPTATESDISRLCQEAIDYDFSSVCIAPYYIKFAKNFLENYEVKIATVIGFPFGYSDTSAKLTEIKKALEDGADELDMVHNLSALKNRDWKYLENEVRLCVNKIHAHSKIIKLIVETGELTDEELKKCCEVYSEYKIDFMKTSTGYAEVGATVHAVELMRKNLPKNILIKASGGIRNFEFAQSLINAGANRLGCSSSIKILNEIN